MKRQIKEGEKVMLRVRVSEKDVHYAGGLVDGAYVLHLFGDTSTEVCVRFDGDEGLLLGYKKVELKKPVHAGDFLECTAWISKVGNTSRIIELEAHRYIKDVESPKKSSADYLTQPELVAKAQMVAVVPKECQRCSE